LLANAFLLALIQLIDSCRDIKYDVPGTDHSIQHYYR